MKAREAIQEILEGFQTAVGDTPHVYYNPPETVRMVYPCIVYHFVDNDIRYANNGNYLSSEQYSLTYITRKADPELPKVLMDYPRMVFERHYTAEELHHFMFTYRTGLMWTPSGVNGPETTV